MRRKIKARWESFLNLLPGSPLSKGILALAAGLSCWSVCDAQTKIEGFLTGANAQPMVLANVSLLFPDDSAIVNSSTASADGHYEIWVPSSGIWILRYSGVAYREHLVALPIESPQTISIDVTLGTYRFNREFKNASIVGTFNRWYLPSAVPMKNSGDSVYTAEVDADTNVVIYRLSGVRLGDTFEGTMADHFVYDAVRGYVSVLNTTEHKAKVIFDPRKLDQSSRQAVITFSRRTSRPAKFAHAYDEMQLIQDAYFAAMQDSMRLGKFRAGFSYDWSASLAGIDKEVANESDTVVREELSLVSLIIGIAAHYPSRQLYARAFQEISPASLVWSLNPHVIYLALRRTGFTQAEQDKFVMRVIETNPSAATKAALLFDEFMVAKLSDRPEKAAMYSTMLLKRFPNSKEAAMAKQYQTRPSR